MGTVSDRECSGGYSTATVIPTTNRVTVKHGTVNTWGSTGFMSRSCVSMLNAGSVSMSADRSAATFPLIVSFNCLFVM